jgi:hypothetical protein
VMGAVRPSTVPVTGERSWRLLATPPRLETRSLTVASTSRSLRTLLPES